MDKRTVWKDEQDSKKMPLKPGGVISNRSITLHDLNEKRTQNEKLDATIEERKKVLESLQTRRQELQSKIKSRKALHLDIKTHKNEDANRAAKRAENEKKMREEELERLKEKYARLLQRKNELQQEVEKHAVCYNYMEQVVNLTKFVNPSELANHLESLLFFRDKLFQRDVVAEQQVDEIKKSLATLKEKCNLERLQRNNELSLLQTELERTLSETATWERKWNHVLKTAAKKTLQLGEIKLAALNLYEMTNEDELEGEDVDMKDTEQHLDKVKTFLWDNEGFLKQFKGGLQRNQHVKDKK